MQKLLEIMKVQYFWEAERRDKLNSSSSIPIGFGTVTGTIATTIIPTINTPFNLIESTICLLLGLSLVFFILFVYQTVRFFLGPIYKYIATSDEIFGFWKSLDDHHRKYPELGNFEDKFDEFLTQTFSTCATINCKNNDSKSNRLYKMNQYVLAMLLPCLLSGVLIAISSFNIDS